MFEAYLLHSSRKYHLLRDPSWFGRDPRCLHYFDDNGLSRLHAVFMASGERWLVIDLRSANGVQVNGQRVDAAYLSDGDGVKMGSQDFTFHLAEGECRPAPRATRAQLVQGTRSFDIGPEYCFVGRDFECRVRYTDELLSRRHAVLVPFDGSLVIFDLKSANGVYVNGKRVHYAELLDGDRVEMGEQKFECRLVASKAPSPRARRGDGAIVADFEAPSAWQGLTEIVCVIDRSGSMLLIRKEAIAGFNDFLAAQKSVPGKALLSLVLFNHIVKPVVEGIPIQDATPLLGASFVTDGETALYDAIGETIRAVEARHDETPEDRRPAKVVLAILTDGAENASRTFSRMQVREMIEEKRDECGWDIFFFAANQDAAATGAALGIDRERSITFAASPDGTIDLFREVDRMVGTSRTLPPRGGGEPTEE